MILILQITQLALLHTLFPVIQLGKIIKVSGYSINSSCKRIKMEIGAFKIDNSTFPKFSGVHFDHILKFEYHM